MRDCGQEVATQGSRERDAGLWCGSSASECMTVGRNGPSLGEGRVMTACQQGIAPATARPCTAIGDVGQREEAQRLASREQLLITLLEVTRIGGRGKVTQIYIKLLKPVPLNYFLFRLC